MSDGQGGQDLEEAQAMIEHCRLLRHAGPIGEGARNPPMGTGDRAP